MSDVNGKTYRLGDALTLSEAAALGLERRDGMAHLWGEAFKDGLYPRCVRTDEFRAPKAGEWYLSGAFPVGYRAPNDLSTEFRIMRLVVIDKRTVTTERRVGLPGSF
jgi:hypothetical protein